MTADEIIKLVQPEHLVHFEADLQNAQGMVTVPKGALAAIKLIRSDSWGFEIAVFDSPIAKKPVMLVTENDLAGKVRGVTEDEIRAWIRRGENADANARLVAIQTGTFKAGE